MQQPRTSTPTIIPAYETASPSARDDLASAPPHAPPTPSFREFHARAVRGERINVVFLGGSLTWGACASDPQTTSYRAIVSRRLQAAYPQARFTFWDAAVGGMNSLMGVFRLERDVLKRDPDLVFVDFSVNDELTGEDLERLISYEAIIRRLVLERCCIVQMILGTQSSVVVDDLASLTRRTAHRWIAGAYSTAVGDAIPLMQERIKAGRCRLDELWPDEDKVHPSDVGYELYAEAAWHAFTGAIAGDAVCAAPPSPIFSEPGFRTVRARFSSMRDLPHGWVPGRPNAAAAFHDMRMSRWLDEEVIASNCSPAFAGPPSRPCPPSALRARFTGAMALILGESTLSSCSFSASIDGHPPRIFDAGALARGIDSNTHLVAVLATDLDPRIEHDVEITPIFHEGVPQELRLESLCVAGSNASVTLDG